MSVIKVGFDYDEPIFPWYDYAHEVSVAAGLARAEDPPPTRWDPHNDYGCTQEEWFDVLNAEVRRGHDGMYGRPCKPEAVAAIRRLYAAGFEIHLVTARGSFGAHGNDIKRLTARQVVFEGIPNDGLHFAPDKTKVIRNLGLDYFLDDRPKHYDEAVAAGADVFLLNERWNQDLDVPENRRVNSVQEYCDYILGKHGFQRELTPQQRLLIRGA